MTSIKAFSDAQKVAQDGDNFLRSPTEAIEFRMFISGYRLVMVSGNSSNYIDLLLCKPQKFCMLDELETVTMMTIIEERNADIMQQRGILK
jgi:hypothetical protein